MCFFFVAGKDVTLQQLFEAANIDPKRLALNMLDTQGLQRLLFSCLLFFFVCVPLKGLMMISSHLVPCLSFLFPFH